MTALTFVDGPYGMGKYPGDEIETYASEELYRSVFHRAYLNGSAHLVICGTFHSLAWVRNMVPSGFTFRSDIVWHKPDWVGGSVKNIKTFSPRHELLLHYSREDAVFNADAVRVPYGARAERGVEKKAGRTHAWLPNPLGARRGDVWTIPGERLTDKVAGRTRSPKHSCEKPRELLRVLVAGMTAEGQTVDEPFYGSDNLALVCGEMGRVHRFWPDARDFAGRLCVRCGSEYSGSNCSKRFDPDVLCQGGVSEAICL